MTVKIMLTRQTIKQGIKVRTDLIENQNQRDNQENRDPLFSWHIPSRWTPEVSPPRSSPKSAPPIQQDVFLNNVDIISFARCPILIKMRKPILDMVKPKKIDVSSRSHTMNLRKKKTYNQNCEFIK